MNLAFLTVSSNEIFEKLTIIKENKDKLHSRRILYYDTPHKIFQQLNYKILMALGRLL